MEGHCDVAKQDIYAKMQEIIDAWEKIKGVLAERLMVMTESITDFVTQLRRQYLYAKLVSLHIPDGCAMFIANYCPACLLPNFYINEE